MRAIKEQQYESLKPIMYELGAAVYISQLFEMNLLLLISLLSGDKGIVNTESFTAAFDKLSKKTLGKLAGDLKSKITLPSEIKKYIQEGVETRNIISHNFVINNRDKFLCKKGRKKLVAELIDAQYLLKERLDLVEKMLDAVLKVMGGSMEQLSKEADFLFEPDEKSENTHH